MTTPQKPIDSGFGMRSGARDVLAGQRLDGRVAIVTGGYSVSAWRPPKRSPAPARS